MVAFNLTSKNKIKTGFAVNTDYDDTTHDVTESVYKVDGNYIELKDGDGWTRISKDAVVYTTGKTYPTRGLDKVKSYSDINEGDAIEVLIDKRGDIVVVLIWKEMDLGL
ncbi:MAG: hypothetical protein ACOX2A_01700 [Tepidanaerobacteraceae bacterium]